MLNPLQQSNYKKKALSPVASALDERDGIIQVKPSLPPLGLACFVMRTETLQ